MTIIRKGIHFLKADGKVPNGMKLEVLVNGKIVDVPVIQLSFNPTTHFRVISSEILKENKPCEIKKSGNPDESVMDYVIEKAREKYTPQGIRGIFSRPRISVRYHNSCSTFG